MKQRTKEARANDVAIARAIVGCTVHHGGEEGYVRAYCEEYEPAATLVAVEFADRTAYLRPSEIGAS